MKKYLVLIILSSLLLAATASAQGALDGAGSGLVGWWKFDDAQGSSAFDSSGNSNTGTLQGTYLPQWVSGKTSGALDFSNASQYATAGTGSSLDISANQLTIAAWVNPTLGFFLDDSGTVLSKAGYTDGYRLMVKNSGQVGFQLGGNVGYLLSTSKLTADQWSHVAAIYDGAQMRIYINGVQDAKVLAASSNLLHSSSAVLLGSSGTKSGRYSYHWNGLLDDVRVYNRALSAVEISELYNQAAGNPSVPAPAISAVSVSALTPSSATIAWTTDQPADSQVEYDLTSLYHYASIPDITLVVQHTVALTGLQPNTVYHYRVSSRNASGNRAVSLDYTFTTQLLVGIAPTISNGSPFGILPQNAKEVLLAVTTDVKATCKYGATANTPFASLPHTFMITGNMLHTDIIPNLVNGDSYSWYVRCQDTSGNTNTDDYAVSCSVAPEVGPGSGTTYTVKQDGTGNFTSIQACANVAAAGDTCLVYAGNYPERVATKAGGASTNYLTFQASGAVVIKGFDIKHNYVKVDGFEVTNDDNSACVNGAGAPGIRIYGDYDVVVNNYVHDIRDWGIYGYSYAAPREAVGGYVAHNRVYHSQYGLAIRGTNWVVENNEVIRPFMYCPPGPEMPYADCDYSRFFGQTQIIRNNYYHGAVLSEVGAAHLDCFQNYDNDGPQSVTNNVLIKENMCLDLMQGTMFEEMNLYPKKSGNFVLINNVFARTIIPGSATAIICLTPYVSLINNTLTQLGAGAVVFNDSYNVGPLYGTVKNNLIAGWGPYGYGFPAGQMMYEDYNLEIAYDGTAHLALGYVRGPHDITADPLFTNPTDILGPDGIPFTADDGLRLQQGSPAISAGENGSDLGAYPYAFSNGDVSGDGKVTAYDAALALQLGRGELEAGQIAQRAVGLQ